MDGRTAVQCTAGGFQHGSRHGFMGGPARWRGKRGQKRAKREREGVERADSGPWLWPKQDVWTSRVPLLGTRIGVDWRLWKPSSCNLVCSCICAGCSVQADRRGLRMEMMERRAPGTLVGTALHALHSFSRGLLVLNHHHYSSTGAVLSLTMLRIKGIIK